MLPAKRTANQVYCSATCRNRMNRRRATEAKRRRDAAAPIHQAIDEAVGEGGHTDKVIADFLASRAEKAALYTTGGPAYQRMMASPNILGPLLRGEMTHETAAELLGYHSGTISKVMEMIATQLRTEADAAEWELSERAGYLVGIDLGEPRFDDPALLESYLEDLTDRFIEWRDLLMVDERGRTYITKPFHRRWITSILWAIFTGKRQMILSPPRHGKTQLLIDFCTWLICRDPHIRILWIASNGDLAEDWLAAIKQQLEENEALRDLYLAPGQDFKPPPRSGKSWSRQQFSVDTRTRVVKSPSMQGVGRRGRILSRDVDLMIIDDVEDDESTATDGIMAKTRKWITVTAGSRKEAHTGVVVIGSRQDPQDLYGHLLENPEWEAIVEEAHSTDCDLPVLQEHLHVDCMLFPEKNDFAWLMSQKRSMDLEGSDELFEMVYLNKAIPKGLEVFDIDAMKRCRDLNRPLGVIPHGCKLVAGLDPAVAGYQSAVLWAWHRQTQRWFLIDGQLQTGPGIEGFLAVMREWHTKYNGRLRHWIVESNGFQRGYGTDPDIRKFKNTHGIHIEGHETQANKWDKRIGVGAMGKLFKKVMVWANPVTGAEERALKMSLPYEGPEAVALVGAYLRQAKNFGSAASQARTTRVAYKSDLLMASWFPMKVIRRWQKEAEAEDASVDYTYATEFGDYRPDFDFQEEPWPLL